MLYRLITILVLLLASPAWGANCGGSTSCACGDVVTSDYIFTNDLACESGTNSALYASDGVTIDLGGYTLSSDGSYHNGILVDSANNVTVQNGTISGFLLEGVRFSGTSTGGVVRNIASNSNLDQAFQFTDSASATLYDVTAIGNTDDAISSHSTGTVRIYGGTFTGNANVIGCVGGGDCYAEDLVITGNTGFVFEAGAWGCSGTVLDLTRVTVVNDAGVVMAEARGSCELIIRDSTITGDSANLIVQYNTSKVRIIRSTINVALSAGSRILDGSGADAGAITEITRSKLINTAGTTHTVYTLGHLSVVKSEFRAPSGGSSSIFIGAGTTVDSIAGNTFWDVTGTSNGIYSAQVFTTYNNIFYDLGTAIDGEAVVCDNCLTYSNVSDGTATYNDKVAADPLFRNVSTGDVSLRSGSPAIDTGAVLYTYADHPGDFIGAKVYGAAPDIGAYEYQDHTSGGWFFEFFIPTIFNLCASTNANCYIQP